MCYLTMGCPFFWKSSWTQHFMDYILGSAAIAESKKRVTSFLLIIVRLSKRKKVCWGPQTQDCFSEDISGSCRDLSCALFHFVFTGTACKMDKTVASLAKYGLKAWEPWEVFTAIRHRALKAKRRL